MKTDELIDALATSATPINVIHSPGRRTMAWFVASLPYVAIVVFAMSLRPDIHERLTSTRFQIEQMGALITSLSAAYFALSAIVPGRRSLPIVFLAAPIGLWLGSLLGDSIVTLINSGWAGLALRPDFFCIPGITMVSAFPAVVMTMMLRDGAPLAPRPTVFLGALAASALGNFGLRLFHTQDAGPMVLFWQIGTVALICFGTAWIGDRILNWQNRIDKGI